MAYTGNTEILLSTVKNKTIEQILRKVMVCFPDLNMQYDVSNITTLRFVPKQYLEPYKHKSTARDRFKWLVCETCLLANYNNNEDKSQWEPDSSSSYIERSEHFVLDAALKVFGTPSVSC